MQINFQNIIAWYQTWGNKLLKLMMIWDIKDGRTFPDIGNVRLQMQWSPPSTSFSQGRKYSIDPVKKTIKSFCITWKLTSFSLWYLWHGRKKCSTPLLVIYHKLFYVLYPVLIYTHMCNLKQWLNLTGLKVSGSGKYFGFLWLQNGDTISISPFGITYS